MSQSLSDAQLQQQLADKLAEVKALQEQLAERSAGKKRARPEPEEDNAADDEEKSAEPVAKRQKTKELEVEDEPMEDSDEYSDGDEPYVEEKFANGTFVAVAYGNVNGMSKRRWYAAEIMGQNDDGLYTVQWKYPPRSGAKKMTFAAEESRMKEISKDDYENATEDGSGYVGLHRATTFAVEPEEPEDEGVQVGDHVAVAYGSARANQKGTDPTKGRDTKKFHKRFLWYAATVTSRDEDDVTVAWAVPFSKKDRKLPIDKRSQQAYFDTTLDKVQAITAKEFKKAKKSQKARKAYGLVGIHRVETKADLTSGN